MKNILFKRKIYLGKLNEYGDTFAELEIRKITGEIETVDHKIKNEILELAICGEYKFMNNRGYAGGGQCDETFKRLGFRNLIIEENDLKRILEIWDTYHLNTMNPGCIHQKPFNANIKHDEWKRKQSEETAKCPNGYHYGTKWLAREIPEEIIDEIKAIFSRYN